MSKQDNGKILVSSCLIGKPCAYDGKARSNKNVLELCRDFNLVDICPEVEGGLLCPRLRNEIFGGEGKDVIKLKAHVIDEKGNDNTRFFIKGANQALKLCKENNIQFAIMKSKSPSCGKYNIYNGQFDGILIDGSGVATALLERNGIKVFTENEIELVEELINGHRV